MKNNTLHKVKGIYNKNFGNSPILIKFRDINLLCTKLLQIISGIGQLILVSIKKNSIGKILACKKSLVIFAY